ncbi:uncharacterized protein LOC134563375 [Prinia subflava]|uniref:uncharacterized protein LOC134563375 n=1 Tax=Prinia subflava TaxID=208062 RepID=UPI002FE2D4E7
MGLWESTDGFFSFFAELSVSIDLKPQNDFHWGPVQQQAFAQIKQEIAHAVALGPVRIGPERKENLLNSWGGTPKPYPSQVLSPQKHLGFLAGLAGAGPPGRATSALDPVLLGFTTAPAASQVDIPSGSGHERVPEPLLLRFLSGVGKSRVTNVLHSLPLRGLRRGAGSPTNEHHHIAVCLFCGALFAAAAGRGVLCLASLGAGTALPAPCHSGLGPQGAGTQAHAVPAGGGGLWGFCAVGEGPPRAATARDSRCARDGTEAVFRGVLCCAGGAVVHLCLRVVGALAPRWCVSMPRCAFPRTRTAALGCHTFPPGRLFLPAQGL